MEVFVQGAAGILLAVIIGITLEKSGKEMVIPLTVTVCCAAGLILIRFLEPVVGLIMQLQQQSGLDGNLLKILLKAVGIGIMGELSALICSDSGNSALGKLIQILTSAAILWISIPLFQQLLQIIKQILGGI